MCVKEFLGYNCGHCSIPFLRQCPLSASNPIFPICNLPAERPFFTNEYCHACARVVWNEKILRDEEKHRDRHLRGKCFCEVIFGGEDRERRGRPRPSKNKGKAEYSEGVADGGAVGHDQGMTHQMGLSGVLTGEASEGAVIRYGYGAQAQAPSPGYAGYYYSQGEAPLANPEQSHTTSISGYNAATGQLMAGQFGAGMKWYPQDNTSQRATSFPFRPAPRASKAFSEPIERYLAEPAEDSPRHDFEEEPEPRGPAVVSGEMVRPDSSST